MFIEDKPRLHVSCYNPTHLMSLTKVNLGFYLDVDESDEDVAMIVFLNIPLNGAPFLSCIFTGIPDTYTLVSSVYATPNRVGLLKCIRKLKEAIIYYAHRLKHVYVDRKMVDVGVLKLASTFLGYLVKEYIVNFDITRKESISFIKTCVNDIMPLHDQMTIWLKSITDRLHDLMQQEAEERFKASKHTGDVQSPILITKYA